MLATVAVIIYVFALGYAAVRDLLSYEIPNWIALALVGAFFALAYGGSVELSVVGSHLSAGFAVLVAGAVLFYAGIVGGGDAKLLAACAVWTGWSSALIELALLMALFGGVLALFFLVMKRVRLPASWTERAWLRRLRSSEQGIPYGVAIGLGGILVLRDLPLASEAANGIIAPLLSALPLAIFA